MADITNYPAQVTAGSSGARFRTGPGTSYSIAYSFGAGYTFTVLGYVTGENVSGEDRWWKVKDGTYVWVGATIEKPGTPAPAPTPTPTPNPPAICLSPDGYVVSCPSGTYSVTSPLVSFSDSISFYNTDKVEIRIYNVDDIAKVYIDGSVVKQVSYHGDEKFSINPGLSVGNHTIKLTVENITGGWTYGFDIIKNGTTIKSWKEGEVGITGAKNNDLGIGKVVDINLTATVVAGAESKTDGNYGEPLPPPSSTVPAGYFAYTLQKGDTLWDLATKYLGNGSRWKEIIIARLGRPATEAEATTLQAGEVVYIPLVSGVTPPPSTPTPTPTPTYTCPYCGATFSSQEQLNSHMLTCPKRPTGTSWIIPAIAVLGLFFLMKKK